MLKCHSLPKFGTFAMMFYRVLSLAILVLMQAQMTTKQLFFPFFFSFAQIHIIFFIMAPELLYRFVVLNTMLWLT